MYDFDGLAKEEDERREAKRIAWELDHPKWREEARKRKAEENKFRRDYYGLNNPTKGGGK